MSDLRIQHTEEMVGAGHELKADTLNRLTLVEHNNDGTHKSLTRVTDPYVDVRAYGATGDGVTNDTTAVQNAINSGKKYIFFPDGTYLCSNLTVTGEVYLIGSGGATIKQSAASGVLVKFYNATAFNKCGIASLKLLGVAMGLISGNYGIHVENVLYGFYCHNVEISTFGEHGFYSNGNTFGADIQNLYIHDCKWGYGVYAAKGTYRFNAAVLRNIKVINCDGGVLMDDTYGNSIHGLWVEVTATAASYGTKRALSLNNCVSATVFGGYIEWNSGNEYIGYIANSQGVYVDGVQVSSSNGGTVGLTNFIRFGGNNTACGWKNSRLKATSGGAFATCISVSASTDVGTDLTGNYYNNFTTNVSDSGTRTKYNESGYERYLTPWSMAAAGFTFLTSRADGDSNPRFSINADGQINWGSGGASVDVNLYRDSADILRTGDNFYADGWITVQAAGKIYSGTGSPEGAVTADIGSIYLRTDGGAATSFYVKESGMGNTGWAAK